MRLYELSTHQGSLLGLCGNLECGGFRQCGLAIASPVQMCRSLCPGMPLYQDGAPEFRHSG